jgi:hypothetical protein
MAEKKQAQKQARLRLMASRKSTQERLEKLRGIVHEDKVALTRAQEVYSEALKHAVKAVR